MRANIWVQCSSKLNPDQVRKEKEYWSIEALKHWSIEVSGWRCNLTHKHPTHLHELWGQASSLYHALSTIFRSPRILSTRRHAIQKYLQNFQVIVQNIERYGVEFGNHLTILKYIIEKEGLIHADDFNNFDKDIKQLNKRKARDQFLAISFLLGGTCAKYSQLVADLQNSYILGVDQYPKDVEECYDMMLGYSKVISTATSGSKKIKDLYTTGISFYQSLKSDDNESQDNHINDKVTPGLSGKVFKDVVCYSCNKKGHYANDWPNPDKNPNTNINKGFCMA